MVSLFPHQYEFVTDVEHRYLALRAGYGAGKTFAFCMKAIHLAAINCQTVGDHVGIICEPTYPLINDVLIPALEDALELCEIPYSVRKGGNPEFVIKFATGTCIMKMRSAENYKRLVGVNAAWAGVDEMDTIDPATAEAMWKKLQGRVRHKGAIAQFFTTSTPEGFRFMYKFFMSEPTSDPKKAAQRRVIKASTYDNPELPPEFIEDLELNYSDEEKLAYLSGEFVNLATGRIYKKFDRALNNIELTIQQIRDINKSKKDIYGKPLPLPTLHIGMDFNISHMAGIVHIIDDLGPVAVDEIIDVLDTEAMIEVIKERYEGFKIVVYPDPAGDAGSHASYASASDIEMLKKAGFQCVYNPSHPPVKDRINSMNQQFCSSDNVRHYRVNVSKCKRYTECLEQQTYTEAGVPDKKSGNDHANDAAGYFIHMKFPIRQYKAGGLRLQGMY